ncbi:hypothetical protein J2Z22_001636 [Paenibacillus forsythiae]|uniref:Uncharacterized protein n=1 Tax=Paenibacillus forsythiae TaxID=365616 RepID=A0ABU3H5L7_9BACL|nr:hypothetical protein [Paenibacillus forsythiae]MDT3426116.1 hypothetical protein [Paenibacillus forsythiae]
MKKQVPAPYNPGLSDKAWDKLHKFLAAANVKYAEQIQQDRKAKQEDAAG